MFRRQALLNRSGHSLGLPSHPESVALPSLPGAGSHRNAPQRQRGAPSVRLLHTHSALRSAVALHWGPGLSWNLRREAWLLRSEGGGDATFCSSGQEEESAVCSVLCCGREKRSVCVLVLDEGRAWRGRAHVALQSPYSWSTVSSQ